MRWLLGVSLILLFYAGCDDSLKEENYNKLWGAYMNNSTQVDSQENEWSLLSYIQPDDLENALAVIYKDEMGFNNHVVYCMVIWESKKTGDYKCTASWIDKFELIKKSNILSIKIDIVKKDSVEGLCG